MDRVRVGVSATLSGRYSLQGIESFNGLKLWADNLNNNGGLQLKNSSEKVPVELIHYDDRSVPANTEEITKKLILEDKVDILLGPYSSSLSLAAANVSESYDRVLWNYGGSTDEITSSGFTRVISTITPASRYFDPFLEYISGLKDPVKRIAVVYAGDSGFATQVARGAMDSCNKLGIDYKSYSYPSGTDNFGTTVREIASQKINCVLGAGRFEDDLNLAPHMKGFFACLVGASIEEFKVRLGNSSEGYFSVTQWEPRVDFNPDFGVSSKQFSDLYKNKYKRTADYIAAQSFNIGVIFENFITSAGTVNEKHLMKEVIGSEFSTFYGRFKIERSTGIQVGHKTLVTQWQKGKKEIIFPYEQHTSKVKTV